MKDPRTAELLRRLAPLRLTNQPRKREPEYDPNCEHCGKRLKATWNGPKCDCPGWRAWWAGYTAEIDTDPDGRPDILNPYDIGDPLWHAFNDGARENLREYSKDR